MVEGRAFKAGLGRASGPSLITSPLDVGSVGECHSGEVCPRPGKSKSK